MAPLPVLQQLGRLLDELRGLDEGQVATYIPELGRADPSWFGICIVTADGHAYEVGDTGIEFTIQSISKPFVLGVALEDQGRAAVLERVGVEPSGNSFNAIVVDDRNRPFNPMVNAGAILATSLVDARDHDDRIDRMVVGVDRDRRLATVEPGVAVGELAFLEDARRSADVVAERDSRLGRLAVADLQELGAAAPAITATVSANLARNLSERLGCANPHVRMLAG